MLGIPLPLSARRRSHVAPGSGELPPLTGVAAGASKQCWEAGGSPDASPESQKESQKDFPAPPSSAREPKQGFVKFSPRLSLSKLPLARLSSPSRTTSDVTSVVVQADGEIVAQEGRDTEPSVRPPPGAGVGLSPSPRLSRRASASPRRLLPLSARRLFGSDSSANGTSASAVSSGVATASADGGEGDGSKAASGDAPRDVVQPEAASGECSPSPDDAQVQVTQRECPVAPVQSERKSRPRGATASVVSVAQRAASVARSVMPSPRTMQSPRTPAKKKCEPSPGETSEAATSIAAVPTPSRRRSFRRPFGSGTKEPKQPAEEVAPTDTAADNVEGGAELWLTRSLLNAVYERALSHEAADSVAAFCPEIGWLAQCALSAPQPPGWRVVATPGGARLYANTATGETSEDMPLLHLFARMAKIVLHARQNPGNGETSASYLRAARGDALQEALQLQEGWTGPHQDATTGKDYYYCEETGTSSWDGPSVAHAYVAHVANGLLASELFPQTGTDGGSATLETLAREIQSKKAREKTPAKVDPSGCQGSGRSRPPKLDTRAQASETYRQRSGPDLLIEERRRSSRSGGGKLDRRERDRGVGRHDRQERDCDRRDRTRGDGRVDGRARRDSHREREYRQREERRERGSTRRDKSKHGGRRHDDRSSSDADVRKGRAGSQRRRTYSSSSNSSSCSGSRSGSFSSTCSSSVRSASSSSRDGGSHRRRPLSARVHSSRELLSARSSGRSYSARGTHSASADASRDALRDRRDRPERQRKGDSCGSLSARGSSRGLSSTVKEPAQHSEVALADAAAAMAAAAAALAGVKKGSEDVPGGAKDSGEGSASSWNESASGLEQKSRPLRPQLPRLALSDATTPGKSGLSQTSAAGSSGSEVSASQPPGPPGPPPATLTAGSIEEKQYLDALLKPSKPSPPPGAPPCESMPEGAPEGANTSVTFADADVAGTSLEDSVVAEALECWTGEGPSATTAGAPALAAAAGAAPLVSAAPAVVAQRGASAAPTGLPPAAAPPSTSAQAASSVSQVARRPASENVGPRPLPPPPPAAAATPSAATGSSLAETPLASSGTPALGRGFGIPPLQGERGLPPGPFLAAPAQRSAAEEAVAMTPPVPTTIPPAPTSGGGAQKSVADEDNEVF